MNPLCIRSLPILWLIVCFCFFCFWVVFTFVLFCLLLLMDGFPSLIFIYMISFLFMNNRGLTLKNQKGIMFFFLLHSQTHFFVNVSIACLRITKKDTFQTLDLFFFMCRLELFVSFLL